MQRLSLPPCFHPTTVVVIDDNEAFLQSLTLHMPERLVCHGFTSPEAALAFLNEPLDLTPLVERCFTLERASDSEPVIRFDRGAIEREINHPERFRRISVVLVDYAMPAVDGLQLCERMLDRHARRALLTGVADEKLAVQAFNAGLIHRFIPKHQVTEIEAVLAFVAELEREYFTQYSAGLRSALAVDPPGFLVDPDVAVRVHRLLQEEAVVEYYLTSEPPGFLMLTADGTAMRLLLLNERDHQQQIDFVRRFDAPAEIRRGIESGALVGNFSAESPADYFGDEAYHWDEKVVPAERLQGRVPWLLAVMRDAAADIDFDPARSSYSAFRASLGRR